MTIPPRFLDELRSRLNVSDIVGRKVKLTRAGREYKGCCPFHKEKTPSFYVNDEKGFYHCFGCGAHGSVIDFAMNHDNLSFPEAIETLASEAGMQVPQASPEEVQRANKAKSLHALLDDTTTWMEEQLRAPENAEAYQYIKDRGFPDEVLYAYRIGFAPADRQILRSYLKSKGYSDKDMIDAGVLRPGKDGRDPYAFFRDRVMFPVTDKRGRVVAYGGRILPDHLRPPQRGDYVPAKYMNSSNTPLFDKGRTLYGAPHARQAASDGKPVLVVEGYLDVMACAQAGFKGAVAPLGTALTEEQIPLLWRMIPQDEKVPILCFDGDNAGRRAAARAVERILPLLKPNHSCRIAFLPEGQDPDSLIKAQGASSFQAILSGAMPLVDFLWKLHTDGKALDTPEARAGLNKTLQDDIARIPDKDVQYYYSQAIREKTSKAFAPKTNYQKKGGSNWPQKRGGAPRQSPLKRPGVSKMHVIETALVAALVNYPALAEDVEEEIGTLPISDKRLDHLRQHVLSTIGENPSLDFEGLQRHLIDNGFEADLRGMLSQTLYTHAPFIKPGRDLAAVKEGWKNAYNVLQDLREREGLQALKAEYAQNMTAENENRMMAMREGGTNYDEG